MGKSSAIADVRVVVAGIGSDQRVAQPVFKHSRDTTNLGGIHLSGNPTYRELERIEVQSAKCQAPVVSPRRSEDRDDSSPGTALPVLGPFPISCVILGRKPHSATDQALREAEASAIA